MLLAHCPNEYNQIEIEDAETGAKLATWEGLETRGADVFHSRLQVSPGGRYLLSAGWVWHPWDVVGCFDVARALEDPAQLGSFDECAADSCHVGLVEESSAAWLSDSRFVLAGGDEEEDAEASAEREDPLGLRSRGVGVYDIHKRAMVSSVVLDRPAGTMMAVGEDHIVAFYKHPRLIRLSDGAVLHEWKELQSGEQISSISHHIAPPPPLTLDPRVRRFALATDEAILIVAFAG